VRETARLAERETLSYERYLLQLVTRECEDRQRKRIERLLHQSRIPAEKALSNFSLKRLPPKLALITKTLLAQTGLSYRAGSTKFFEVGATLSASVLRSVLIHLHSTTIMSSPVSAKRIRFRP
jgi:hypothetical protein